MAKTNHSLHIHLFVFSTQHWLHTSLVRCKEKRWAFSLPKMLDCQMKCMLDEKEMFYCYLLIYFPFVFNGVASQLANRALAKGVVQYKHFNAPQKLFLFLLVFDRFPHTLNLFLKHDLKC